MQYVKGLSYIMRCDLGHLGRGTKMIRNGFLLCTFQPFSAAGSASA